MLKESNIAEPLTSKKHKEICDHKGCDKCTWIICPGPMGLCCVCRSWVIAKQKNEKE